MPNATRNDAVNGVLTDFAVGYSQDNAAAYLATQLPEGAYLRVKKKDGSIYKWNKGDMLRRDAQKRAAGASYARTGVGLSTVSFVCEEYGLEIPIDDGDRENFMADGLDVELAYTAKVTGNILQERDNALDAAVFLTGVWDTDWDGVTSGPSTNQFLRFDESGSVPVTDITLAGDAVKTACGRRPNIAICGEAVWTKGLRDHSTLLDKYKHTQPGILTTDLIARALGLDALIVADAAEDTAAESATSSLANLVQTNDLWLGYIAPTEGNLEPSAFKIVSYADEDNPRGGVTMESYRDESARSDIIRGRAFLDVLITAADAGAYLEDAVS